VFTSAALIIEAKNACCACSGRQSERGNEVEGLANRMFDLGTAKGNQRSPPPAHCDIETDVLVVGAGVTGALIADALAMSELKVTVVDKRGPAKGSTTASTRSPAARHLQNVGRRRRCAGDHAGPLTSGTFSPSAVAKSIWWSCSSTRICRICSAMANSPMASHCRTLSR
jgi:hypothetical protein